MLGMQHGFGAAKQPACQGCCGQLQQAGGQLRAPQCWGDHMLLQAHETWRCWLTSRLLFPNLNEQTLASCIAAAEVRMVAP